MVCGQRLPISPARMIGCKAGKLHSSLRRRYSNHPSASLCASRACRTSRKSMASMKNSSKISVERSRRRAKAKQWRWACAGAATQAIMEEKRLGTLRCQLGLFTHIMPWNRIRRTAARVSMTASRVWSSTRTRGAKRSLLQAIGARFIKTPALTKAWPLKMIKDWWRFRSQQTIWESCILPSRLATVN